MNELQVSFQIYGNDYARSKIVPSDFKLGEALEVARLILGESNDYSYLLGLDRTKEILNPLATFQSAGIQADDKLVLIVTDQLEEWRNTSPQVSPVEANHLSTQEGKLYTLSLKILGDEMQQWTYSILLNRFYEDHPQQFFTDDNKQEQKKFEDSLRKVMLRPLKNFEVEKVIRLWCEDIEQGYQHISLKL